MSELSDDQRCDRLLSAVDSLVSIVDGAIQTPLSTQYGIPDGIYFDTEVRTLRRRDYELIRGHEAIISMYCTSLNLATPRKLEVEDVIGTEDCLIIKRESLWRNETGVLQAEVKAIIDESQVSLERALEFDGEQNPGNQPDGYTEAKRVAEIAEVFERTPKTVNSWIRNPLESPYRIIRAKRGYARVHRDDWPEDR